MTYDEKFYKGQQCGSHASAEHVVPMVLEFVHPRSVLDVGAGVGTWLSVFRQSGIEDIQAVDGDYVRREMLRVPVNTFTPADLSQPLHLNRTFDLVVSLEVAEHLPGSAAETFVDSLVRHGSVILFSAAIPHQWGAHHVNEQWPEYWAELFARRGYRVIDCLRPRIWGNENVECCYRQNTFFYASQEGLDANPLLKEAAGRGNFGPLSLVHPWWYMMHADPSNAYLKRTLPRVGAAMRNAVRRRVSR